MAAIILTSTLLASLAMAQSTGLQSIWGQCGGSGYSGPTVCPQTLYCTYGNAWYSQCVPPEGVPDEPLPGSPGAPGIPDAPIETTSFQTIITITPTVNQPIVITTYITYLTPVPTVEPTEVPATITFGGSPITILPDSPVTKKARWINHERQPAEKREEPPKLQKKREAKAQPEAAPPTPGQLQANQYWIRAVADPNFHKYLQTSPANEPGTAVVGPPGTAGQYNIADGQLVSSWTSPPLYLHVEKPADFTQRKLATWFNTTKNEFGTFVWSGDALTWTAPEVKRQNLAAWLVCENKAMFINTGAYAYQTPAGCADQTIHYYNGATANN